VHFDLRQPRWVAVIALLLAGCDPASDGGVGLGVTGAPMLNPQCQALPLTINSTSVRKDGIPALTGPEFVSPDHPDAAYVKDSTRVVGVVLGEEALAIPLNILWWHEIVNLSIGGSFVAVTYCPLTGSSIVFDRLGIGGVELRVSGLLYDNNLIMFDKTSDDSLWPQMLGQAICGPARGQSLSRMESIETSFSAWRLLHPETQVASVRTGHDRDYSHNPYEDGWRLDSPPSFGATRPDARRSPQELTLVIPSGERGGIAFPFLDRSVTGREVLHSAVDGTEFVVFWDGPSRTAEAFFAVADWPSNFSGPQTDLTFTTTPGGYVDDQTGSTWTIEGNAVAGPGTGATLLRKTDSYVAFWFAWTVLRPELEIF